MKIIYLIESTQDEITYYKIGITTKSAEKRLKELQTGNVNILTLKSSFSTNFDYLLESTLHRIYAIDREHGEWFRLTSEQVENFLNICYKTEKNLECINEHNTYFQKNNKNKFC